MIATENFVNGRVEVKYYSNHTNHQLNLSECGNLPLPKSIEEEIKQQEFPLSGLWKVCGVYMIVMCIHNH